MTPVTRAVLGAGDRARFTDLAPVLRRAVELDPAALARFRLDVTRTTVYVRLPFGVLVARTIETPARAEALDVTLGASEALSWCADAAGDPPEPQDARWRAGLPPATGWRRLDSVPDDVVRPLVRAGAMTLKELADREGVPGAQPRAEVSDALLDATVLTVDDEGGRPAAISLRALSALTRMGFLPRDGVVHVDVAGRWARVVAQHGTVFQERPGSGLVLS